MEPDDVVPSLPSLNEVMFDSTVDYRWLYLAEVSKTKELRREIEQLQIELKRIQLSTSRNADSELRSGMTSMAGDSELQSDMASMAGDSELRSGMASMAGDSELRSDMTLMAGDSELRSDMTSMAGDTELQSDMTSMAGDSEMRSDAMSDAKVNSTGAVDSAIDQKIYQRQRIRSSRSQPNKRLITHNLNLRSAASKNDWATDGLVRDITDTMFNLMSDDEQTDGADAFDHGAVVQGIASPTEVQLPLALTAQVQCRSLLWDNDDNDGDEVGVELHADNCDATLLMRTNETDRDEGRLQSSIDRQARVQQLRRNARRSNHRKQPRSLNSTRIASIVLDDIDVSTVPNSAIDLPKVGDHHNAINAHRYVSSSDSDEDDTITASQHATQNLPVIADSPLFDESGRSTLTGEEELDNRIKRWASGKSIFHMLRSLREVSHASIRILERSQVLQLVDSLFSERPDDIRRVYL